MSHWCWLALAGGLGAAALEAAQVSLYVQRSGHTPWRSRDWRRKTDRNGRPLPRLPIYVVAVVLKTLTGLTLVGTMALGNQVGTPFTALLLGAASSDLILRATQQVSLPSGIVQEEPAKDGGTLVTGTAGSSALTSVGVAR